MRSDDELQKDQSRKKVLAISSPPTLSNQSDTPDIIIFESQADQVYHSFFISAHPIKRVNYEGLLSHTSLS